MAGRNQHPIEFETLLRPHLDRLYRLAYRLSGNSDDAKDLVQELVLRLYRSPRALSDISALRPWLDRAMHNVFVDHWRQRQRSPFGHLHSESWEILFENEAGTQTPEQEQEAIEFRHRVLRALYSLCKEHRALLVMHDMEGRSLPELAQLLELPIGTLKSRLFRARRKLREALSEGNVSEPPDVLVSEVSEYGL